MTFAKLECESTSSPSCSVAESLFEKLNRDLPGEKVSTNQRLADEMAGRFFHIEPAPYEGEKRIAPEMKNNPQLPGKDSHAIVDHEKERWSSIFECTKWAGGVVAAHRWAPQCMPSEVPPAALLQWKQKTGQHFIYFGGKTHAELVKEMKARYTAACIGSMVVGWTAGHVADRVFFPHDQYMEATLAGDIAGIAMAIAVPGWRSKALLVAGTHILGKTIDHWRQPPYL